MENIQMVDLKSLYFRLRKEIDEAIQTVIEGSQFIKGPEVSSFENELSEYLHVKHVIGCANGTDALQLAMMALNLQPGDEVITTPFSFVSTAETIALLNLKPVFVDIEQSSFNIDSNLIEKVITEKTKAIIPVHLFGQCANMERIMDIANKFNLFVIEDTAQALGADFIFSNGAKSRAGTIGNIGTTSFFPSKNLGCFGDGGANFTNNDELELSLRSIANHGMHKRYFYDKVGMNSRLDTLQAAVLRVKLKYLEDFNSRRQHAACLYDEAFENFNHATIPFRSINSSHIFNQYTIKLHSKTNFGLKEYLKSFNIPSMIYYPLPLHLQDAFKKFNYRVGDFPVAESLCNKVISLPMHTELNLEQIKYIVAKVKLYFVNK